MAATMGVAGLPQLTSLAVVEGEVVEVLTCSDLGAPMFNRIPWQLKLLNLQLALNRYSIGTSHSFQQL